MPVSLNIRLEHPAGFLTAGVRLAALFVMLTVYLLPQSAKADTWAAPRSEMVEVIRAYAKTLPRALSEDPIAESVLQVMNEVPRHLFVPVDVRSEAYADRPLPIGLGQTISQPLIVALMTHLLKVGQESKVLEIGTGSGYQAAVLSPLVQKVCSIEIIPELGRRAARLLTDLAYPNIETRVGDGYFGWVECGPFDGIIVTAAAGHIPPPLVQQLKPGGRMVIPVGSVFGPQYLTIVEKNEAGEVKTRQLLAVRFVPLTRHPR